MVSGLQHSHNHWGLVTSTESRRYQPLGCYQLQVKAADLSVCYGPRWPKPKVYEWSPSHGCTELILEGPTCHSSPVLRPIWVCSFHMSLCVAGKYLVFFFYPLDFTFVCPTEIVAFSERVEDFRKLGVEVRSYHRCLLGLDEPW